MTHPPTERLDKQTQWQARITASISLSLLILNILFIAYALLAGLNLSVWDLIVLAWALLLYLLSRSPHYPLCSLLMVVSSTLIPIPYAMIAMNQGDLWRAAFSLTGLSIAPLITYLLFSIPVIIIVTVFNLGIVVLLKLLYPLLDIQPTLLALLILGVFLLLAAIHRQFTLRESKRESKERRLSEERYRLISRIATDYAFVITMRPGHPISPTAPNFYDYMNLEWVNDREEFLGYPVHIFHQDIASYVHPDDHDTWRESVEQSLKGQPNTHELRIRAADQTWHWIERILQPVQDSETGQTIRVYGVLNDITARKETENQRLQQTLVEEQMRVLQRFVSEAAHDLFTPLTTIRTSLYLLNRLDATEPQQRHIDRLERQTNQIETALKNLLKLSGMSKMQFVFETASLNPLIQEVIKEQGKMLQAKSQTILFTPDPSLPLIDLDLEEMKFVIRQMIANACANSPEGRTITIKTSLEINHVVMTTSDEGYGIPAADLPHIFEPFYRVGARNTERGGIGVGLTIARRIVEAHQGHIEAESVENVGSIFRVYLPKP